MLRRLQEKAGFISIETIIVAGLMIALGAFAISQFYANADTRVGEALDRVDSVMEVTVPEVTP